MSIEVRNVSKSFDAFQALKDVSLTVATGELVALLGPSGCGKTSLLRIIAGLEPASSGTVLFSGEDATGQDVRDRNVGFVFQHYALFRHMTVFENVAFGLRVRPSATRPSKAVIRSRVMELLKLVQLEAMADRYPSQLSGGQRQRVALARALAVEPKVLLLDEPFGSLDARIREELRRWLRRLHDEIRLTSVFVTHDHEEALDVADRVVVMNAGRIEQIGTPQEIFDQPATPFVMTFLGQSTVFPGRVEGGRALIGPMAFELPGRPEDGPVAGYARPHDLELSRQAGEGGGLWATVHHVRAGGGLTRLELSDEQGQTLHADLTREQRDALRPNVGERFYVRPRALRLFVPGTGTALTAAPMRPALGSASSGGAA